MLLSILLVIIFLAILVLVHEFGHFVAAKLFGVAVEEFGIGFPPAIVKKKIGETVYSINWIFAGGFVRLLGEERGESDKRPATSGTADGSFSDAPWWKRVGIIVGGVLMNFILGWFILSFIFMRGVPAALIVTDVAPFSPAAQAEILPGDKILSVDASGQSFTTENHLGSDFIDFISRYRGKKIELVVDRGGELRRFSLVPRMEAPAGQGALGIAIVDAGVPPESFLRGLRDGFTASVSIVGRFFSFIGQALVGRVSLDQVSGPVGVFKIGIAASHEGFDSLLQLFALISLNLAVFNILPIPALDGGRLLFLILEKIKGSPLSPPLERRATAVSFAVLIVFLVFITIKDVGFYR